MFDSIGGGEIMLILLAILVLFGPKRIPDLAQSLGKGMREFRKAQQELQNNLTKVVNSDDMTHITGTLRGMQKDMQESVQKLTQQLNIPALPASSVAPPVPETPGLVVSSNPPAPIPPAPDPALESPEQKHNPPSSTPAPPPPTA